MQQYVFVLVIFRTFLRLCGCNAAVICIRGTFHSRDFSASATVLTLLGASENYIGDVIAVVGFGVLFTTSLASPPRSEGLPGEGGDECCFVSLSRVPASRATTATSFCSGTHLRAQS